MMEHIPACIFTYSGGELLVPICCRVAIGADLIPVVCQDAASPLLRQTLAWLAHESIPVISTTFPRRGNLNGTDCAAAICRTLAEACRQFGSTHALKLDDDTGIFDPRVFFRHPKARAVGLTWPQGRPGAYGMAYMIREDVADAVADKLERMRPNPNAPEDITIWETAKRLGPVIENRFRRQRGPFSSFPLGADPYDALRRFSVLNVGTPPPEGWSDRKRQMAAQFRLLEEANLFGID